MSASKLSSHLQLFALSAGVKLDPSKAWCPVRECQAVCSLQPSTEGEPTAVPCMTCHNIFCSGCRGPWQDGHICPEHQPMMPPSHPPENGSVSCSPPAESELQFDAKLSGRMFCLHVSCTLALLCRELLDQRIMPYKKTTNMKNVSF